MSKKEAQDLIRYYFGPTMDMVTEDRTSDPFTTDVMDIVFDEKEGK